LSLVLILSGPIHIIWKDNIDGLNSLQIYVN